MCWTTKKPPIKRVAEKDIKCIKFGNLGKDGKIISPFYEFRYTIGRQEYIQKELCPDQIIYDKSKWYTIEQGFHSYSTKIDFRIVDNNKLLICKGNLKIISIYELSVERIKAIDCVIPKGSTYYINEDDEIVSNCIKAVRTRDIKRWSGFMAWLKIKLLYLWRIL